MSRDVLGNVTTMLQLQAMAEGGERRPPLASMAWEMDIANAESLVMVFGAPAGAVDITADGLQCLGIPVTITDRPGIRLVFTVSDR